MNKKTILILAVVLIGAGMLFWVGHAEETTFKPGKAGRYRMSALIKVYSGGVSSTSHLRALYFYDTCTGQVFHRNKERCKPIEPKGTTVGRYQDLKIDMENFILCDTTTGNAFAYNEETAAWDRIMWKDGKIQRVPVSK